MQIAKWGNSLAVRLPASLVRQLGLKEGDRIDLRGEDGALLVRRYGRPEDVLATLDRFEGRLTAADRLTRDAADER